MEAKKLRDLMKKEKEKRATDPSRVRAPARTGLGGTLVAASVRAPAEKRTAAPMDSKSQEAVVARQNVVATAASSPASGRDSEQPPAMEPRMDAAIVSGGPPAAKKLRNDVDAQLMPPPSIPSGSAKARSPQVERGQQPAVASPQQSGPAPQLTPVIASMATSSEELDSSAPPVLQAAVPKHAELTDAAVEDAEDDNPTGLPEGFFDNPDEDAKVRGVEAPTEKAKRELEEGLKRFEREMVVEQERAEVTRHELDEEKFEEVTAEELDFQSDLLGRLQALRQQAAKLKANAEADEAQRQDSAEQDATADDEDDGSGSDVDFDWRAKGFG